MDKPAISGSSPTAPAADAIFDETAAIRRVMELMPDVRLDENMNLVQIEVEGAQAASYEASAAHHDDGDVYTFLSQYLHPEDVSYLRQTDEASQRSASRRSAAIFAGIEARFRSQLELVAFHGGPESSVAAASFLSRTTRPAGRTRSSRQPVPTSSPAVAVKKLETKRYGGPKEGASADDSTGCVICIQDYKVGEEITVVPCSGRHRFHQRCLDDWFARKRLCPLCRHALPAELQRDIN